MQNNLPRVFDMCVCPPSHITM